MFRALAGIAFAQNISSTYNPIADSTATQLLYDKFYSTPGEPTQPGYKIDLNLQIKSKHRQKFTGAGAGTQTGEVIYIIIQSDYAAGTAAPVITGVIEEYFKP